MAQPDKAHSRTPDAIAGEGVPAVRQGPFRGRCPIFLLAIGVLALVLGTRSPAADKPASPPASAMSRREALERFRERSPEARLTLAEAAAGEQALIRLTRADLVVTITARGMLEPRKATDVYCTARSGAKAGANFTIIKWIIDEGAQVKKGDKLMELDSSGYQDQLKDKTKDVETALAAKLGAEEDLKITQMQNKLDLRGSEIALKVARINRKKYTGTDADEKDVLELKIEQAQLGLDLIKRQGKAREAKATAELNARAAILELETARKREIEAEIAKCLLTAPQDGLVVYYVPEQVRGGGGVQQSVVAQGEPVREGQKMMRVCNLEQFIIAARVHDSLISRVRLGQPAQIRVDAFPRRVLRGRVRSIAAVPSAPDWFNSDVKFFGVKIDVTDNLPGLKPGMSADVHLEIDRMLKVLQVPLESVVRIGRETFCYVKVGKGLQERKVKTGKRNERVVEITDGLKEDEQVLRAPGAVARPSFAPTGRGPGAPGGGRVLTRSMRVRPESGLRRSWIESYGLTYTDLERIRTVPDVVAVAAVRGFPADTYYLDRLAFGHVIATVPEYQELAGIRLAVGRFLDDADGVELKNVAVLGAEAAERLFPEEEPLGKVVRVSGSAYVVVGVLEEQTQPASGLTTREGNRGVYLPLRTANKRFGARVVVRRAGVRTAEAVQLSEILVGTRSTKQASFVAESISELLEEAHSQKDWDVRVGRSLAASPSNAR